MVVHTSPSTTEADFRRMVAQQYIATLPALMPLAAFQELTQQQDTGRMQVLRLGGAEYVVPAQHQDILAGDAPLNSPRVHDTDWHRHDDERTIVITCTPSTWAVITNAAANAQLTPHDLVHRAVEERFAHRPVPARPAAGFHRLRRWLRAWLWDERRDRTRGMFCRRCVTNDAVPTPSR